MAPDATFYNIPFAFELSGPLDRARFEQALRTIVDRHESLRTSFETDAQHIVQHVRGRVDLPYSFERLDRAQARPSWPTWFSPST